MSGLLRRQETFYVGTLKGVGRICQQTFIDNVLEGRLCEALRSQDAADGRRSPHNDRVVPFFEEHGIRLSRVLTDRGTEYCGQPDRHEHELYLAVENIDHTRTKTKYPQANGICERFNKTVLNEFSSRPVRSSTRRSRSCRRTWTCG